MMMLMRIRVPTTEKKIYVININFVKLTFLLKKIMLFIYAKHDLFQVDFTIKVQVRTAFSFKSEPEENYEQQVNRLAELY